MDQDSRICPAFVIYRMLKAWIRHDRCYLWNSGLYSWCGNSDRSPDALQMFSSECVRTQSSFLSSCYIFYMCGCNVKRQFSSFMMVLLILSNHRLADENDSYLIAFYISLVKIYISIPSYTHQWNKTYIFFIQWRTYERYPC